MTDRPHTSDDTPPSQTGSRDIGKRAGWVWNQMTDQFGGLWCENRGESPSKAWLVGLSMLSDDEIKQGIRATIATWRGRMPPTWSEFRELARPTDGRTGEQRARDAMMDEVRDRKLLPGVEQLARGSKVGAQWLAWMRLRGLRPMPPGMTADDLDAVLADADIAAMDAAHERELANLRARMHAGG